MEPLVEAILKAQPENLVQILNIAWIHDWIYIKPQKRLILIQSK